MNKKRDETLEEIWAIRRLIAKKMGDDPRKWVGHFRRLQRKPGVKIHSRAEHPAAIT